MPAYKDKDRGTWYCSFYYQDFAGNRQHKKKRGFQREKDAKAWEREFLLKEALDCNMTFESLVQLYFEDMEHRLRGTTITNKKTIVYSKIIPYFGSKKVNEISPVDIRKWQNVMKSSVDKRGNPFKPTYLRTMHAQLSTIFNYAVKFYHLKVNPCHASGSMGRKKADKMSIWTVDQFNAAMEQVSDWGKRLAFKIMFWNGLRIGECLALTPTDILPEKKISVTKTYHREYGEDLTGPTKTENSVRLSPMTDFLYEDVQKYIAALYGIEAHDRIFYFTKSTLNKALTAAAAAAGLPQIRVHDLRHSHAAMLVEMGCSIVLVAERLGDTVEVAMSTYSHLYPDKQEAIVGMLNGMENGFPSKK